MINWHLEALLLSTLVFTALRAVTNFGTQRNWVPATLLARILAGVLAVLAHRVLARVLAVLAGNILAALAHGVLLRHFILPDAIFYCARAEAEAAARAITVA